MNSPIVYFSRCVGEVVELPSVSYIPSHVSAIIPAAYPGQARVVCDSRKRPIVELSEVERVGGVWLLAHGRCPICGELHLADRLIDRTLRPSLHECDSCCMFARGHLCECACGGKNHGAGMRSESLFGGLAA